MISVIMPELTTFLLSPSYFCGRITGSCPNRWKTIDPSIFINKNLEAKPEFIQNNDYIDTLYDTMETSNKRDTL